MRRLLLFVGVLLSWQAFAHKSDFQVPNLSVTIETEPVQSLPSPALRQRALESLPDKRSWINQDELDLDRLYLRTFPQGYTEPLQSYEEASPSKAKPTGQTIVFLDLNFAPAEIKAARLAAEARGDQFVIYPERTQAQSDAIEVSYRKVIALQGKQRRLCSIEPQPAECEEILRDLSEEREKLQRALSVIQPIAELKDVFADLSKKSIRPSVFVFSGHSSGSGDFVGQFGAIQSLMIEEAFRAYPHLLDDVKSFLLWGCYSGTINSFVNFWLKAYPQVPAIVGYRNQAPLGIREASGRLLKSYLSYEKILITETNRQKLHAQFRKLDLVATLDATAVVRRIYLTYNEVDLIDDLIKRCDELSPEMMDKYICYQNGATGCENPPKDHQGPLRSLYTFLQHNRHCSEILRQKYPDLPNTDSLIRLIYMDDIKANFAQIYGSRFSAPEDRRKELGFDSAASPVSYKNSTRAEDIRNLSSWRQQWLAYNDFSGRDQSYIESPNWLTVLLNASLMRGLEAILQKNWGNYCAPFSWIEPNASELSACIEPASLEAQPSPELVADYYRERFWTKLQNWGNQENILLIQWLVWLPRYESLDALRDYYQAGLAFTIDRLTSISNRTGNEELALKSQWALFENVKAGNLVTFVAILEDQLNRLQSLVEQQAAEAKEQPDPIRQGIETSAANSIEVIKAVRDLLQKLKSDQKP